MTSGAEPKRTVWICDDLDAYRSLLPDPFGRDLFDATSGTSLDEPMFDLVSAWRCASDAHALPKVVARAVPDGIEAFVGVRAPYGMLQVVVNRLATDAGLLARVRLSVAQRLALQEVARNLLRLAERELQQLPRLRLEESWRLYLSEQSFRSAIVGLSFYAFTSLYFAYECYLSRIVRRLGTEEPRNAGEFRRALNDAFGREVGEELWESPAVAAARAIRHAHVHRADRLERDEIVVVRKVVPCEGVFPLVDATETRRLIGALLPRVMRATALALAKLGETPTRDAQSTAR